MTILGYKPKNKNKYLKHMLIQVNVKTGAKWCVLTIE